MWQYEHFDVDVGLIATISEPAELRELNVV